MLKIAIKKNPLYEPLQMKRAPFLQLSIQEMTKKCHLYTHLVWRERQSDLHSFALFFYFTEKCKAVLLPKMLALD